MGERAADYDYELQETEFTFKEAVKTRAYWLLVTGFGIQMLIMGGINIHIIPFLTDIGIDRAQASGLMAMMVFFTIPSRFFGGVVTDLVGKKRQNFLLAAGFLIQATGLTIFLLNQGTVSVYVFLVLYGLSSGASTPLFILTLGRYFGRIAFGSIFGSSMAIWAPVSLFAPVLSGWIFDTTGSYIVAFVLFAAFAAIASLIMGIVKPVKPPAVLSPPLPP
jgi:nitrate/nitrite transporter NarK